MADEYLADFLFGKGALLQAQQKTADLIHRRQKKAQHGPRPHGAGRVFQIFPGSADIQKERVGPAGGKAVGYIALVQLHIIAQSGPIQIAAGQLQKLLPRIMADDPPCWPAKPGKAGGQPTRAATGLDDGAPRARPQPEADIGNVLGVDDLRLPLQALQTVVQGGLLHEDGDIQAGTDFRTKIQPCHCGGTEHTVIAVPVLPFLKAFDVASPLGRDIDNKRTVGDHALPCLLAEVYAV